MQVLLREGKLPGDRHARPDDDRGDARSSPPRNGIGKDHFEFQMLYGIRRDLQSQLTNQGYRVRVYVPFGREWFPYFMRRLGERPANAASC